MEVANQPKLKFHGVDFINIKFNSTQQYDGQTGIDLNIDPKVFYPENNELFFRIFMEVSIVCNNFFELNLVGLGNFEFDKEFDDIELKKTFVNANAPAIMFPYVRAFITSISSNLGNVTGPLVLPTQFFQGDLPEKHRGDSGFFQAPGRRDRGAKTAPGGGRVGAGTGLPALGTAGGLKNPPEFHVYWGQTAQDVTGPLSGPNLFPGYSPVSQQFHRPTGDANSHPVCSACVSL